MFTLDEQMRGLDATREQVAALFQSINAPHVVIPGRQAGPAQAFIVCKRSPQGFSVGVYLWLAETRDCAVYATDVVASTPDDYRALQTDALGFVESMGFMMDNLNFRGLPAHQQQEVLQALPFHRGQNASAGAGKSPTRADELKAPSPAAALAQLFASF